MPFCVKVLLALENPQYPVMLPDSLCPFSLQVWLFEELNILFSQAMICSLIQNI